MQYELYHVQAIRSVAQWLSSCGIDITTSLNANGIHPKLLTAEKAYLFKQQAWRWFREVAQTHHIYSPAFVQSNSGFSSNIDLLGKPLYAAKDLRSAIQYFADNISKLDGGSRIELVEQQEISWLYNHTQGLTNRDMLSEQLALVDLREVVRLVSDENWQPLTISLTTEPIFNLQRLPQLAFLTIKTKQVATGIAFKTSWLDKPLTVEAKKRGENKQFLQQHYYADNLQEAFTLVIQSYLGIGEELDAHSAAAMLAVSRTTLFRMLKREGLSWRELVEQGKMQAAKILLTDSTKSIKQIAYILCYQHPNNFSRSFKKIYGISPIEYREKTQSL